MCSNCNSTAEEIECKIVKPMKIKAQEPAIEKMVTKTRFGSDNMFLTISFEYREPPEPEALPLKTFGVSACISNLAGCFTRRLQAR